jgi:hypothetical protein
MGSDFCSIFELEGEEEGKVETFKINYTITLSSPSGPRSEENDVDDDDDQKRVKLNVECELRASERTKKWKFLECLLLQWSSPRRRNIHSIDEQWQVL